MIARTVTLFMLLAAMIPPAWGLNGSRLLSHTVSGQTLQFDLGYENGGVRIGDFGVIIKEVKDPNVRDLRLVPVGKAKNIKLNANDSVWVLYKTIDRSLLKVGEKYLLFTESALLYGKRDLRLGKITVVTDEEKAAYAAQNTLTDDKDRIAKLKETYPEAEPLHGSEARSDNDVDLVEVEAWNKVKDSKHRTSLYKSPYKSDFQRQLRLETFEKMVTAYLKKVNDPNFNYDAFYDDQMKTEFSNEFRKKSAVANEYQDFLSVQGQKASSDAKLYRAILEKGDSWSEDFSDEELRSVLREVSILQERDRRKFIVANPNPYAFHFDYGMALNDEQTDSDVGHRRGTRFAVELELEATPFVNHPTLERITLHGSFRANRNAFAAGSFNADLNELSLGVGVNWYPIYAPHVVEAPSIFIGTYMRSGWASVAAPTFGEEGNYTVLSIPGIRTGMRYNFQNDFGLRILASFEVLTLDQYESTKIVGILPQQKRLTEGKISFGLVYSF
ncbi:MAG TPA: hypothetical protein VNJ01_05275 [Bacteriovoracaceae bacterium]|nr:hypothetical protein [Bacteriovoracaceae bacterium]